MEMTTAILVGDYGLNIKSNYKQLKKNSKELIKRFNTKKNNHNIIMGCDLSGHSTGISIIDKNDNLLFMDKIYIPSYSSTPTDLRIITFVLGLQEIINKFKPSIAIVEDIFSTNIATHSTLARYMVYFYIIWLEIILRFIIYTQVLLKHSLNAKQKNKYLKK